MPSAEHHRSQGVGWLRPAVLGANDGIVSTASLLVGIAAASASHGDLLLAGAASVVAGAMSMAAGEYVSVSSQRDTERADLALEKKELAIHPELEHAELAAIYVGRGLTPALAADVAAQLMAHDALAAHARDELGIEKIRRARPLLAAGSSALAFAVGAGLPLVTVSFAPQSHVVLWIAVTSLVCLTSLGAVAARAGGAPVLPAAVRVAVLGALAMAATALVGSAFGVLV
ncbi:MAG: VIT family protein [Deltaproteobacteria bacterium]|nr:VIT family protein [Deltaproteobacteria bacterium]